jgi:GT2 family glycosyltransferase
VIPTLGISSSLERSVESALAGSAQVVLVVDHPPGAVDVPTNDPRVRVVWTGGGAGFAGATQIGIDASDTEYVLLLNDDAWMLGGLAALVEAVTSDSKIAGAAPKVFFSRWPEILNSVGTVLHADGWADSRGIGQPDVGQYDTNERVFGLHFAAALVRRELFGPASVGPLDVSYRAYFEDIDWCLRANLLGYSFVSVPEATASHEQSTTSRQRDFSFRYRLQQRNQLLTAFKCLEARHAAAVLVRRAATLLWRASKRDPLSRGGVAALAGFARRAPAYLRRRSAIQRSRIMSDDEIFALSTDEHSWFDDREGPTFDVGCLVDALRRRGDMSAVADEIERYAAKQSWADAAAAVSKAPPAAAAYWNRLERRRPA